MKPSSKKLPKPKKSLTSYSEIKDIIGLILNESELGLILELVAYHIERQLPSTRASILLFDEHKQTLRKGASPSLPKGYTQRVDGLKIGPEVATCGTAAYFRTMIVARDTFTDPLWNPYLDLAMTYNIRASWSLPILNMKGELLGTFALYYTKKHKPLQKEMILVKELVDIVCLAIERDRAAVLKKQTEKEMHIQRVNAVNSLKHASLGEMAKNIAHEINSPLAVIIGSIHQMNRVMESEKNIPDSINIYSQRLIRSVNRIEKVVKGLRSITREASEDPFIKTSANDVIQEAVSISQERFREIEFELSGEMDSLFECKLTQMAQIILNLLNNSFDAIAGTMNPWIKIHVRKNNGYIQIEIMDSGEGIPKDVAEKIMVPLFTTKTLTKATGLGLSISQALIQEHSGKIWYDKSSKNTRFIIELPIEQRSILKQAA